MSITFRKLRFEDVKAECIGENAVIRVNEMTVKHQMRNSRMFREVSKLKVSDERKADFGLSIRLMSVCTDPETGEFTFGEDQLEYFTDNVPGDLLESLMIANGKVNPINMDDYDQDGNEKTLSAKKKST